MSKLNHLQQQQRQLDDTLNALAAAGADPHALAGARQSLSEAFVHLLHSVRHLEPHHYEYRCGCGKRYSVDRDAMECPDCEGQLGPAELVLCHD